MEQDNLKYVVLGELIIILLIILINWIIKMFKKHKEHRSEHKNNLVINKYFECKDIKDILKRGENNMKDVIEFEYVQRILDDAYNDNGILKNEYGMIKLPERGTKSAAGYDFFNLEEVTIQPKEIKIVKTGVKAKFPEDMMLLLLNRSSNAKKKGLVLMNGIGLIDADYYNNEDNEGEIGFMFMNITEEPVTISFGDKLGQGVFTKYFKTIDDEVDTTRTGGWGSTGK